MSIYIIGVYDIPSNETFLEVFSNKNYIEMYKESINNRSVNKKHGKNLFSSIYNIDKNTKLELFLKICDDLKITKEHNINGIFEDLDNLYKKLNTKHI